MDAAARLQTLLAPIGLGLGAWPIGSCWCWPLSIMNSRPRRTPAHAPTRQSSGLTSDHPAETVAAEETLRARDSRERPKGACGQAVAHVLHTFRTVMAPIRTVADFFIPRRSSVGPFGRLVSLFFSFFLLSVLFYRSFYFLFSFISFVLFFFLSFFLLYVAFCSSFHFSIFSLFYSFFA